jgi:A/G-specific adenine glycosylase
MPTALPARTARRLRAALCAGYRRARRDLPWREDRDPYRVWISEAMLQQTRVEAVLPYYRRFLERFPDVSTLASAREEEVLAHWSGLGYYARARKLLAAARVLVEHHGGRFPSDRAEALALPGVGPYTAGAVLSIAYDRPEPLVDGNVARVLCRLFALEGDPSASASARALWALAAELVPREGGAGEWNQALMELGATVCTPRRPSCGECPWRARCAARAAGRTEELPRQRSRKAPVEVELEILLMRRRGRVLLARRPRSGRMAGLLDLPTVQRSPRSGSALFPLDWSELLERGAELRVGAELARLRHSITCHRIQAGLREALLVGRLRTGRAGWHDAAGLADLELSGIARKALRAVDLLPPTRAPWRGAAAGR